MSSKLGFLALLFALLGAASCERSSRTSEAYVTLLYGDEFLLGVRVLGKSIRDTGSKKDMVVLVSDGVSDFTKKLLKADGWKVEVISLLANPNQIRPKRFWGVYTKLKIFNMTMYKKVVYLDADTIVIKSIEDLFQCSKFCANLKHSERLNSGVMVVEPSAAVFEDMMSKMNALPSYTGGDQGFLNSYYVDFANAHLFEPNLSSEARKNRPVPEMERLSTLYNADVGLYMLANKWMVDEEELRVIHYTLGPLKPWDWWTTWLVKPVDIWQNVREQLEETLPGTGQGRNPNEQLIVRILFALPICALLLFYYRSFLQINKDVFSNFGRNSICAYAQRMCCKYRLGAGVPGYSVVGVPPSTFDLNQQFSNGKNCKLPPSLGALSIIFCFLAAILSMAVAFIIVPQQVMPWTGLLLMYEWTFATFFLIFGCYLNFVYLWGKSRASQSGSVSPHADSSNYDSGKGHQRHTQSCDVVTWAYSTGMVLLAVLVPSFPILLGITALFARLGLMAAGGLVFAAFIAYASEHLAIRAFLRGLEGRSHSRNTDTCFLC